jgi:hypothetical protein
MRAIRKVQHMALTKGPLLCRLNKSVTWQATQLIVQYYWPQAVDPVHRHRAQRMVTRICRANTSIIASLLVSLIVKLLINWLIKRWSKDTATMQIINKARNE